MFHKCKHNNSFDIQTSSHNIKRLTYTLSHIKFVCIVIISGNSWIHHFKDNQCKKHFKYSLFRGILKIKCINIITQSFCSNNYMRQIVKLTWAVYSITWKTEIYWWCRIPLFILFLSILLHIAALPVGI